MGFDYIDKQFQKPQPIKLECRNCGIADDTVHLRKPCWFTWGDDILVVLCVACGIIMNPTDPDLIRERDAALDKYQQLRNFARNRY